MGNCFSSEGGGSGAAHGAGLKSFLPFESKGDATSRCNMILKEANEFSVKLSREQKELKALSKAAEAALEASKEESKEESADETDEEAGQPSTAARVPKEQADFVQKILDGVFLPMEQWLQKHAEAQAKQKRVNTAWGEKDGMRQRVEAQRTKLETMKDKRGGGAKRASEEAHLQQLESKLADASRAHEELEEEQYERLQALAKEMAVVRGILRVAPAKIGEALVAARGDSPGAEEPGQQQRRQAKNQGPAATQADLPSIAELAPSLLPPSPFSEPEMNVAAKGGKQQQGQQQQQRAQHIEPRPFQTPAQAAHKPSASEWMAQALKPSGYSSKNKMLLTDLGKEDR